MRLTIRDKKIGKTSILRVDLNENNIIALSDVHLGYTDEYTGGFLTRAARLLLGRRKKRTEFCDKVAFKAFLEDIRDGNDAEIFDNNGNCNILVFCGDILDLWRNDISNVVNNNKDIFDLLKGLGNSLPCFYPSSGSYRFLLKTYGTPMPISMIKPTMSPRISIKMSSVV